jgi:hypothetical protein
VPSELRKESRCRRMGIHRAYQSGRMTGTIRVLPASQNSIDWEERRRRASRDRHIFLSPRCNKRKSHLRGRSKPDGI